MSKPNSVAFANLRAEMSREQIEINDIAVALGAKRDTVSRKLSRKSKITLDEAFKIKNAFFPNIELHYLFSELISSTKVG